MGSVLTLQVRLASVKCDVSVLKIIHPAAAQKTKHTHNYRHVRHATSNDFQSRPRAHTIVLHDKTLTHRTHQPH